MWCLTHEMLSVLGHHIMSIIPQDILAAMAVDPRKVVETNWAVSDEFETVLSDVSIVRGDPSTVMHQRAVAFLRDDQDAAILMGTLILFALAHQVGKPRTEDGS